METAAAITAAIWGATVVVTFCAPSGGPEAAPPSVSGAGCFEQRNGLAQGGLHFGPARRIVEPGQHPVDQRQRLAEVGLDGRQVVWRMDWIAHDSRC